MTMHLTTIILAALFFILLLLGLTLMRRAWLGREKTGLPDGRVTYTDTSPHHHERPLFSRRYRLSGRPDYLIEKKGQKIPVEVKSTACPSTSYRSHVLQLAAYCLLVEEKYHQAPAYGIIKYRDKALNVDYTPELRAQVLATLAAMRENLTAVEVAPNHTNPNRCRRCGYREDCSLRLV